VHKDAPEMCLNFPAGHASQMLPFWPENPTLHVQSLCLELAGADVE